MENKKITTKMNNDGDIIKITTIKENDKIKSQEITNLSALQRSIQRMENERANRLNLRVAKIEEDLEKVIRFIDNLKGTLEK